MCLARPQLKCSASTQSAQCVAGVLQVCCRCVAGVTQIELKPNIRVEAEHVACHSCDWVMSTM